MATPASNSRRGCAPTAGAGRRLADRAPGAGLATALAVLGLGTLLWALYRDTAISADAQYSLVWGREVLDGHRPDFAGLSAPHPLVNLLGIPLAALGDHAEAAVTVLSCLSLAGMVVAIYWLARTPLGLLAAVGGCVLVLTRPAIVSPGAIHYADTLSVTLCIGALLALARRAGATWLPLTLLALAGLIRPEPWLYAGVLALFRLRQPAGRPPLVPLALAAAAGPLIWVLADFAVTGDPVYSFFAAGGGSHGGGPSAAEAADTIAVLPERLAEMIGKAEMLAGIAGLAFVAWRLRSRSLLLAVGVVLPLGAALGEAVAGLPVVGRYLMLPGALLLLLAAGVLAGWRLAPNGIAARSAWALLALAAAAALLAFMPSRIDALSDNRENLMVQHRAREEADHLLASHRPHPSCGPVAVPSETLIPVARWWLDRPPGSVVISQLDRPATGTYLVPMSAEARRVFFVEGLMARDDPRQRLTWAPGGFELVARSPSWALYQRCER